MVRTRIRRSRCARGDCIRPSTSGHSYPPSAALAAIVPPFAAAPQPTRLPDATNVSGTVHTAMADRAGAVAAPRRCRTAATRTTAATHAAAGPLTYAHARDDRYMEHGSVCISGRPSVDAPVSADWIPARDEGHGGPGEGHTHNRRIADTPRASFAAPAALTRLVFSRRRLADGGNIARRGWRRSASPANLCRHKGRAGMRTLATASFFSSPPFEPAFFLPPMMLHGSPPSPATRGQHDG
jgi:hypothetical protein